MTVDLCVCVCVYSFSDFCTCIRFHGVEIQVADKQFSDQMTNYLDFEFQRVLAVQNYAMYMSRHLSSCFLVSRHEMKINSIFQMDVIHLFSVNFYSACFIA